jgi:hypothetical protein
MVMLKPLNPVSGETESSVEGPPQLDLPPPPCGVDPSAPGPAQEPFEPPISEIAFFRASEVAVHAETFSLILHGTLPKAPYEWTAFPIVVKVFLLFIGDELRGVLPALEGKETYRFEGFPTPPPDALDRIERLQTALRTPYVTDEELTPEQVALAKDMLAIIEHPPKP